MNKQTNKTDYLNHLRHSAAHLLAAAVMELWPNAKRTIGPAIEDGFYYDFDFGDTKISEDDFPKIDAKMHEILTSWKEFRREEVSAKEARKRYADNPYKLELIDEFTNDGERLSVYHSGHYSDLCRGGHVEHPDRELEHFKLLSVAGAYWRGSEKNKMLTRIYGTVWSTKEELDHYLWQQEEAKKRDHRKIGKEQDLFLISQSVGGGFPIFTPRGLSIRLAIQDFITEVKKARDYQFVWTPHIGRSELYKQSGHWQKYDAMFNPMKLDEEEYVLKPMNCPHHFQVYLRRPHSYKEFPIRIAEHGTCYRYEKSGELNGLLRVRAVTIDDTHTFVRHDQINQEIDNVLDLVEQVFKTFGFNEYESRISIRDKKDTSKYLGDAATWDNAERALLDTVEKREMPYFVGEGEAAFYGPKIDVMVKDSLGRKWQLSTCQLDFNQPENFDMTYVDAKGVAQRPAVLHIAILGSVERFMGVLIEHFAGAFPTWLAPVQVAVLPVSEKSLSYALKVSDTFRDQNIRVFLDDSSETIGKKILESEKQKIPYMLIVGPKEAAFDSVSVRIRGEKDLGSMKLEAFIDSVSKEISSRALASLFASSTTTPSNR